MLRPTTHEALRVRGVRAVEHGLACSHDGPGMPCVDLRRRQHRDAIVVVLVQVPAHQLGDGAARVLDGPGGFQ